MTADQGLLIGSRTCACGAPLPEYPGVGRPRRWCDECYPTRAPARKQHEVPAGVSHRSGVLLDVPVTAGRVSRADPQTSADAARTAPVGSLPARIIDAYRTRGQLTPFEVVAVLRLEAREDTVRAAVGRMHRDGVLVATGTTRLSPRGRKSMVLKLAQVNEGESSVR